MKIFLTGADGFIGSHLAESLVKKGEEVKALVQYNSFNSWGWIDSFENELKKNIDIFEGDIRDSFSMKKAMKGCDVVIHLAALISIPYSYISPKSYFDTNVNGTLNILEACLENDVNRVLVTSTSEVYGTAKFVPIDENHPLQGQSPYSASKIASDQLAFSYFSSFNLPITIVRPFNTFGPRQSSRAIIPTIITQIASGKKELSLGSLTPTRDFNYVKDLVNGYEIIMKSNSGHGEIINIGSGYEISILDLVNLIAELMNVKITITEQKDRIRPDKSEVFRLLADNKKVLSLYNWKPKILGKKGLINGLNKTIDWFTNKNNLSNYKSNRYNI